MNNAGKLVTHYVYDALGEVVSGDMLKTRYLFTGRELDTATGLQYNWHRWYDPHTGRWVSEDPIGFAGGDYSLSRYVGNQSVLLVDPNGLFDLFPKIGGKIPLQLPAQGRIHVSTTSGGQYSGSTGNDLLSILDTISQNNETIQDLTIKGHGSPTTMQDIDNNPIITVVKGDDGSISVSSRGSDGFDVDIKDRLRDATGSGSTIFFNGCRTSDLAKNTAQALDNGTRTRGYIGGAINVPYSCKLIGVPADYPIVPNAGPGLVGPDGQPYAR